MAKVDVVRASAAVRALLEALGEDITRAGIKDTPDRVARAYVELLGGRELDPVKLLATSFEEGDGSVVAVRGIEFSSLCEHHLLPFTGRAFVAYVPARVGDLGYRVLGLSKLPRLVDLYAARLQIQERLTNDIAGALEQHAGVRGAAVVLRAEHSCARCRGTRKVGIEYVTRALRGTLADDPQLRAEVLALESER